MGGAVMVVRRALPCTVVRRLNRFVVLMDVAAPLGGPS